jgi:hypothetical protein
MVSFSRPVEKTIPLPLVESLVESDNSKKIAALRTLKDDFLD